MSNKTDTYRIFTEQGCLSQDGIMSYLSGRLSENDTNLVQQHIANCDLCKEAAEGAKKFPDLMQYQKGIDWLKEKWGRKTVRERKVPAAVMASIITVAASVVLFMGISIAVRYQKKARRQYLASVYQQGTGIDDALKTSDIFYESFNELKSAYKTNIKDVTAREKFRQMLPEPSVANIPVTLLDETRIVADITESGTEAQESLAPGTSVKKHGILRYPYRVMSMPPPEKTTAGREKGQAKDFFYHVEEMPRFEKKGIEFFGRYIKAKLRYPALALEKHISGRVYVQFTVDEKGRVADVTIIKSCHPVLDTEVLRVINSSPLWEPGKQEGKPVKVSMVMPVDFVLY